MSSNYIEVMRINHVRLEGFEMAISKELDQKPNGQNAKVVQQHHFKEAVDGMVSSSRQIMDSYSDQDGTLHEEIAAMKDPDLDVFYSRLNSTLEHYQKYPALASEEVGDIQLSKSVDFSGEEVFGKYFDLNSVHLQISNICRKYGIDMSDYVHYLEKVDQFFYLPSELRQSKPYIDYLENLWHYLCDFMERVHPLISVDELEKKYGDEFHSRSTAEMLPGANDECAKNNVTNPQPIRLGMFSDVTELEALGMERLKEGLEALGLKCGGTIQDRANRLWLVRGMKPENYPSNLLAKKNKKRKADGGNTAASSSWKDSVQWKEFRVSSLFSTLGDVLTATRRHAEKQQTLTIEEKEAELREEEFGNLPTVDETGVDEDDEGPIYNPHNVPLGWDGKPIPYWLYKLHGLGVEYKCEICGNQSYWGRRAFDRHFQEWKHAHGMRALGIPNTKHFHDITSIDDAYTLYNKIRSTVEVDEFSRDQEEEFEDTEGNILNRRTYEDLARQGLL